MLPTPKEIDRKAALATRNSQQERKETIATSETPLKSVHTVNPSDSTLERKTRGVAINSIMNQINRSRQQESDFSTELFRPLTVRKPLKQKRFLPLSFLESDRMVKERRPAEVEEVQMYYSTRYSRFPTRKPITTRKEFFPSRDSVPHPCDGSLEDLKLSLIRFQRIQS